MKQLILLLLLLTTSVSAQNLIGLKKLDVVEYIQEKRPASVLQWKKTNKSADYLSYDVTDIRNDTYYFNDDAICVAYMSIYTDYNYLNAVIELLNKNFTIYPDKWIDYNESIDYVWTIDRQEGFFAVIVGIEAIH